MSLLGCHSKDSCREQARYKRPRDNRHQASKLVGLPCSRETSWVIGLASSVPNRARTVPSVPECEDNGRHCLHTNFGLANNENHISHLGQMGR